MMERTPVIYHCTCCWVSPQVCMQEESGEQTDVDGRRKGCNLVHAIDGNTRESSATNFIRSEVSEAAAPWNCTNLLQGANCMIAKMQDENWIYSPTSPCPPAPSCKSMWSEMNLHFRIVSGHALGWCWPRGWQFLLHVHNGNTVTT